LKYCGTAGKQTAKGENKRQLSGKTGLLDSNVRNMKEMLDMFKKVIVPLDGSILAEKTLPFVKSLAKEGCVEEVVLLNVVEIPIMGISESFNISPLMNAQFKSAQKYLAGIETQLSSEGIKVKAEILEGTAAKCIVEYAQNNAVDLIVIGTHGYTGMKELVFGSVALRVLHDSHVPVMLIK
jgi:nucleotide-binding universal stress UspA family protein